MNGEARMKILVSQGLVIEEFGFRDFEVCFLRLSMGAETFGKEGTENPTTISVLLQPKLAHLGRCRVCPGHSSKGYCAGAPRNMRGELHIADLFDTLKLRTPTSGRTGSEVAR
jgi:hypothetical protein